VEKNNSRIGLVGIITPGSRVLAASAGFSIQALQLLWSFGGHVVMFVVYASAFALCICMKLESVDGVGG